MYVPLVILNFKEESPLVLHQACGCHGPSVVACYQADIIQPVLTSQYTASYESTKDGFCLGLQRIGRKNVLKKRRSKVTFGGIG